METLSNRSVVVTGGTAGIGRAAALAFARRGARVAVLARGADGLEATRREIAACGAAALAIACDVADGPQVEAAAGLVEQRWGGIDVWVNNAMVTIVAPADRIVPADWQRVTDVTYHGAVHGTLAALRRMKPRDRGVVVQVGSALAYRSIPLQAPYCAAKAALRGFTDALRSELLRERSGVRLTMLQLSAFNTPQFDWARTSFARQPQPVPPIFQPEIAGEAIVRAALAPRREWWIGWPAVQAIWGQRLVPGLLDRLLARRGWDGQFADAPLPEGRRDNLHAPVPGDHGAHGRYDARARSTSIQVWASRHRGGLAALGLAAGALVLLGWRLRQPGPARAASHSAPLPRSG